MDAILNTFSQDNDLAQVVMVVSDRQAEALEKAKRQGLKTYQHPFPPRTRDPGGFKRRAFEREATKRLLEERIDLICLAGFMRIFSAEFSEQWRGRLLNIHPSLLPDFKGLNPQKQALDAGAKEAGCSVHFVDEGVDTGRIILQRRVPVFDSDDEQSLAERILHEEHLAYPEAIKRVLLGQG